MTSQPRLPLPRPLPPVVEGDLAIEGQAVLATYCQATPEGRILGENRRIVVRLTTGGYLVPAAREAQIATLWETRANCVATARSGEDWVVGEDLGSVQIPASYLLRVWAGTSQAGRA